MSEVVTRVKIGELTLLRWTNPNGTVTEVRLEKVIPHVYGGTCNLGDDAHRQLRTLAEVIERLSKDFSDLAIEFVLRNETK